VYKKSDGTCACAFFLERGLPWQQAVEKCRSFGARLPEIYSAEDNAKIFSLKVIFKFLLSNNFKEWFILTNFMYAKINTFLQLIIASAWPYSS
jgi:hypothetical protein